MNAIVLVLKKDVKMATSAVTKRCQHWRRNRYYTLRVQ